MNARPPSLRPCLAATVSLLLATALSAQTAAPTPAPAGPPAKQEEIIELSPFIVTSDSNVGYVANDTLAGSRLRTKLSDVASAVSVFTTEFMNDLAATSELDLMRYSASAAPEYTDQTPAVQGISNFEGLFRSRIRGQLATRARNYFETNLLPDTFNSERVEEARGPNAILFGLGGAGGLLNTSTKQARLNRTSTEILLTAGSWNQLRATFDHNQVLGPKAALRFNALTERADGWHPDDVRKNDRFHLAATFRPWRKVTIRGEFEWGDLVDSVTRSFTPADFVSVWALNGRTLLPSATQLPTAAQTAAGIGRRNTDAHVTFIGNDNTFQNFQQTIFTNHTVATGRNRSALLPDDWAKIDSGEFPYEASFFGRGGYVENDQSAHSLSVEAEPIKNLFLELAFNHDEREHNIYDANINVVEIRGEPAQTYRDGTVNPYAGKYYIETFPILRNSLVEADRYRLTAAYTFDLGKAGRHNLAGLISRDESDNPRFTSFFVLGGAPFAANPSALQNRIWTRSYITNPADAAQWSAPDWRRIPASFPVVLNAGQAPVTYSPTWAVDSASRPVSTIDSGMVSLQSYWLNDRIVTTGGWRRVEYEQTRGTGLDTGTLDRRSYGVVVKPTSQLSLYYNFSENGLVPTSVQTLIPNESLFPINTGQGRDFGVMLSLLDSKLFVRFGYFKSASVDQSKAASVGANLSTPSERIVNALVTAGLVPAANAPVIRGGDFDLADVTTDGYELNITANPTDAWRVIFSASQSDSVDSNLLKISKGVIDQYLPLWQTANGASLITSSGLTIANEVANILAWRDSFLALEGDSTIGHRELQVRLFTRYDFKQGVLKGVFAGGGYVYSGPAVIGKRAATGTYIESPGSDDIDLLLGYQTRLPAIFGQKVRLTLQLNAQNLLQQRAINLVRADTDGQIFRGVVNPPRRYQISARFAF